MPSLCAIILEQGDNNEIVFYLKKKKTYSRYASNNILLFIANQELDTLNIVRLGQENIEEQL